MEPLDPRIIHRLREMAREGASGSQMLHALIEQLAPVMPDKVTRVRYMREAFALTLRQACSLFGWEPGEQGELKDSQIDCLILPGINENRPLWEPLSRVERQ